jgi:hypothetical protein
MHLTKVNIASGVTLFDIIDHNMGNNSNVLVINGISLTDSVIF